MNSVIKGEVLHKSCSGLNLKSLAVLAQHQANSAMLKAAYSQANEATLNGHSSPYLLSEIMHLSMKSLIREHCCSLSFINFGLSK